MLQTANPPSTQQSSLQRNLQSQKHHNLLQRKNPNYQKSPKHNNKNNLHSHPPLEPKTNQNLTPERMSF